MRSRLRLPPDRSVGGFDFDGRRSEFTVRAFISK
jgi:hypothetical protein